MAVELAVVNRFLQLQVDEEMEEGCVWMAFLQENTLPTAGRVSTTSSSATTQLSDRCLEMVLRCFCGKDFDISNEYTQIYTLD